MNDDWEYSRDNVPVIAFFEHLEKTGTRVKLEFEEIIQMTEHEIVGLVVCILAVLFVLAFIGMMVGATFLMIRKFRGKRKHKEDQRE